MIIDKLAKDSSAFKRTLLSYPNARSAFKDYLKSLQIQDGETVLLPAFIGWSANEGSGVFDPVAELSLNYDFYVVDENLHIDLADLEKLFSQRTVKLFVIIHYFGYVDPRCQEAIAIARRYGAMVLEDEAHALYTDLVGGGAGRMGDATIFSLHKMLPVNSGGLLCLNRTSSVEGFEPGDESIDILTKFDLFEITKKRLENVAAVQCFLKDYSDEVLPLRQNLNAGEVPQTYPVIIRNVSRDKLYEMMNSAGYGVVTLYHTMIGNISKQKFPLSYKLANHILNLPIHQEAKLDQIKSMVECLMVCIEKLKDNQAHV